MRKESRGNEKYVQDNEDSVTGTGRKWCEVNKNTRTLGAGQGLTSSGNTMLMEKKRAGQVRAGQ